MYGATSRWSWRVEGSGFSPSVSLGRQPLQRADIRQKGRWIMTQRELRRPSERVGTLGNTALPPPDSRPRSIEAMLRQALVGGDDCALRTVVRALRPEMLRLAASYVRSGDDAEDVVQDTWIAALGAIERFEGRASLKTWLLRILTYRARSAGRRDARTLPLSQLAGPSSSFPETAEGTPLFVSPTPDPEEVVIAQDLRERVEDALAQLPQRQQQVVRLRDLEGWTPSAVSTHLKVSQGNQRVLLHRGRAQLRARVAV